VERSSGPDPVRAVVEGLTGGQPVKRSNERRLAACFAAITISEELPVLEELMKRVLSLVVLALVLVSGAASRSRRRLNPARVRPPMPMQGGMCPMMGGG